MVLSAVDIIVSWLDLVSMNVRDYMHQITEQNANTKASEEGQGEGKKKMTKEETLQEQQTKNKVNNMSCVLPNHHVWSI